MSITIIDLIHKDLLSYLIINDSLFFKSSLFLYQVF